MYSYGTFVEHVFCFKIYTKGHEKFPFVWPIYENLNVWETETLLFRGRVLRLYLVVACYQNLLDALFNGAKKACSRQINFEYYLVCN